MDTVRFQMGEHAVLAVPVLQDNFDYLVCRDGEAVLIDAGAAGPVMAVLQRERLHLLQVLVTHAHHDHTGGCRTLQDRLGVLSTSPTVEAGNAEWLGATCQILSTPGHTAIHKSFYFPELKAVFTGDALINGACGRLLGGTAAQLHASLQVIAALPETTRVFGGHDYLDDNLAFAQLIDPKNSALAERLALYREDPAAALFATLAEEKRTNPFLWAQSVEEFAQLRARKDRF